MRNNRLSVYWVLVFGISWTSWGLLAGLAGRGVLAYGHPGFMALLVVGGIAPAIAAYLGTFLTEGRTGLRTYNALVLRFRIHPAWYAIPFIVHVGTTVVACLATSAFGQGDFGLARPWFAFVPTFAMMIVGGGLEELGWRGLALSELQMSFNPLIATVVLGLVWTVWHAPLFYVEGAIQKGLSPIWFTASVMGHAFILTWLFNKTRSVPICVIYHAAANAMPTMFTMPTGATTVEAILRLTLGVVLVVLLMRKPAPWSASEASD